MSSLHLFVDWYIHTFQYKSGKYNSILIGIKYGEHFMMKFNSNCNCTFIALNLPFSKAQQTLCYMEFLNTWQCFPSL